MRLRGFFAMTSITGKIMSYKILHREEQELFRLPEIKNFLRISHNYDDMWIMELVNSSIEAAENFLRFRLLPIRVQVQQDRGCNSEMILPLVPVVEVTSIFAKTAIEEAKRIERYKLEDCLLKIADLPRFELVTVEYMAGYPDQKTIPAAIKQGILLHTAEMYDSHGTASSISEEVRKLYQPYRRMRI